MNKKIIIFASIIILIVVVIIIINANNENDEDINDGQIIKNDISLFIGKWNDRFYLYDDNSYSTWEFYENNSIKNSTTGLTYDGSKTLTIIKWHEFKLEDDLIYLKFDTNSSFKPYEYVFSNNDNLLSIYETNDILGIPFISLNKIS
jgi:hypothetical protein